MTEVTPRSMSEQEFINQKTRELMVGLCDQQVKGQALDGSAENTVYWDFARSKGWISKDGSRVLAAGFDTASRFLKR
jgi:hypothetical protein